MNYGLMNALQTPSSGENPFPAEQVTYILVHGAFQTDKIWTAVKERLEAKDHVVITPVLDASNPEATLRNDLDTFIEAAGDHTNLYPVLFSRGVELLRAGREMDQQRFLGWTLLNTGGPRSFTLPLEEYWDSELERYTPEFANGIHHAGEGLVELDDWTARNILYSQLAGPALEKAVHDLRPQREPDSHEPFQWTPTGVPITSFRSAECSVHNAVRARLVDLALTGTMARSVEGDHVPSLSAPEALTRTLLSHAAELEKAGSRP